MSLSWGTGVHQKGSGISWQVQGTWESQLTLLRGSQSQPQPVDLSVLTKIALINRR